MAARAVQVSWDFQIVDNDRYDRYPDAQYFYMIRLNATKHPKFAKTSNDRTSVVVFGLSYKNKSCWI